MQMRIKRFLLYCSLVMTFFASWVAIETVFSSYDWWHYQETDGLKVGLLFFISFPLYLLAFIFRKASCQWNELRLYLDTIVPILIIAVLLIYGVQEAIFVPLFTVPLLLSLACLILSLKVCNRKKQLLVIYILGCILSLVVSYILLVN